MTNNSHNSASGNPQPEETHLRQIPLADIQVHALTSPVEEKDREGVYVHSFKCGRCSLHFMTFSWQANRHRVGHVRCPECGEKDLLLHWRVTINQSRTFAPEASNEIYSVHPWPGSQFMDDSFR